MITAADISRIEANLQLKLNIQVKNKCLRVTVKALAKRIEFPVTQDPEQPELQ